MSRSEEAWDRKYRIEPAGLQLGPISFQIGKSPISIRLAVPKFVCLTDSRDNKIAWKESKLYEGPVSEGCLSAFIALHNATDRQILQFARKWGVLGIWPLEGDEYGCGYEEGEEEEEASEEESEEDRIYELGSLEEEVARAKKQLKKLQDEGGWFHEPVSLWRQCISRTRAMLLVGADLLSDEPTHQQDWQAIWQKSNMAEKDLKYQKRGLAIAVSEWLQQITTYPRLHWDGTLAPQLSLDTDFDSLVHGWSRVNWGETENEWEDSSNPLDHWNNPNFWKEFDLTDPKLYRGGFLHPGVRFRPSRLFTVIVLQLISALTSPNGFFRCDNCGNPYTPDRRARADRRRFCSKECAREGHLEVARKSNQKRRARLKQEGKQE